MHIQSKWQGHLSQNISCGIKQGGLCSTFIFNLFYQNLVDTQKKTQCGVRIGTYNCFCYAEYIVVCSTTVTGLLILQLKTYRRMVLINKTSCMEGNPITSLPQSTMEY